MIKLVKTLYFYSLLGCLCTACQSTNSEEQTTATTQQTKDTVSTKTASKAEPKTILFFGNSLTAGYGLEPSQAFPAIIQQKIDSAGWNYTVINSGLSGETTAGGKSRIGWVLRQKVDVFVLELGGNDGLRGVELESTRNNLQAIIDTVRAKNPDVKIILAGMQIPPNMGPDYTSKFRTIYPELAEKNNLPLIPFLLEGVGGIARLNLPDGIHPTAEGHQLVAANVWKVLAPILQEQNS
ncbi:arylesterase [Rhodocytophaga aerolata]|uniref:Arylesterase n=1 Tax=Rhodocytophaga aerolata TaxID=455078 RepID=A0ABT8RE66_9BACT|nr:arylesterase [Rhodocytophaga aerolata]MDO1450397.1 arylesterase [Rhodocytophaga aerolata]